MKIETQSAGVEILYSALPYSNQIKSLDLSFDGYIYFDWRGTKYRLQLEYSSVDESDRGMLIGSDKAILITHLIKMEAVKRFIE